MLKMGNWKGLCVLTCVIVGLSACSGDNGSGGHADDGDAGAPDVMADVADRDATDAGDDTTDDELTPDAMVEEAAGAICGAMTRCCGERSFEEFFGPYANDRENNSYSELADQLPPPAETCESVVAQMLDLRPFGSWVDAAQQGQVDFDADGAEACLTQLEDAQCGPELRDALFDSTCFFFEPPAGGDQQRRMFERTRAKGETCVPVDDGFGGRLYGSCDPNTAFCCFENPQGECGLPTEGNREGTCEPVAQAGEACSFDFAQGLELCETGVDCAVDGNSYTCRATSTATATIGEVCAEGSSTITAECEQGYCDVGGTNQCVAKVANGESCGFPYECESNYCNEGTCEDFSFFCSGT